MTLLEVLTASSLFALLLGGMASSVFLARRCTYEAEDGSTTTSAAASAFFWMSQDIAEAISVEEATEGRLAISVPDRDGDGRPEAIVYSWPGAASSLVCQLNGGAGEPLVEGLADFRFTYTTRSETIAASATYGPEQLLMEHDSVSNLGNTVVDAKEHRGQFIEPALDVDAVSWIASKARLRMRRLGSANGKATFQLRSAVGRLPGGEILAEVVLHETKLPSSYSWIEIPFKPEPKPIHAGSGICLVLQGTGSGEACELQYQNNNSTAAATDFVSSTDGGANWSAPAEQDLLFELYGRVGTLAYDVTESHLQQVSFRAVMAKSGRVVYGSAPARNEPKVSN